MEYLAVLATMKNETLNLDKWLKHYLWQGVTHFYLIDNDSTDNPKSILNDYIDKDIVTYEFLPEKHKQSYHYQLMFDKYNIREKFRWLIICVLDEFYFGVNQPLYKVLEEYEDYEVIVSNWLMFGHQNIIEHPHDIRTVFTLREPELNVNQKVIVDPGKIIDSKNISIHWLNEPHREIVVNDKIHLNHYAIQSYEFFTKVKMQRGDVNTELSDNVRTLEYFDKYNANCTFNDELLKNLVEHDYKN